jgi:hypothetical protein
VLRSHAVSRLLGNDRHMKSEEVLFVMPPTLELWGNSLVALPHNMRTRLFLTTTTTLVCNTVPCHAVLCRAVFAQVDLVAVDSVAALLPRAELEGVIGDQQVRLSVCGGGVSRAHVLHTQVLVGCRPGLSQDSQQTDLRHW